MVQVDTYFHALCDPPTNQLAPQAYRKRHKHPKALSCAPSSSTAHKMRGINNTKSWFSEPSITPQ